MCKKNDDALSKMYLTITLLTIKFDCLANNYSNLFKKRPKFQLMKRIRPPQQEIDIKNGDKDQIDQSAQKKIGRVKAATLKKNNPTEMSSGKSYLIVPVFFNHQIG